MKSIDRLRQQRASLIAQRDRAAHDHQATVVLQYKLVQVVAKLIRAEMREEKKHAA